MNQQALIDQLRQELTELQARVKALEEWFESRVESVEWCTFDGLPCDGVAK